MDVTKLKCNAHFLMDVLNNMKLKKLCEDFYFLISKINYRFYVNTIVFHIPN